MVSGYPGARIRRTPTTPRRRPRSALGSEPESDVKCTSLTLSRFAGAVWLAAGGMLAVRGVSMLARAAGPPEHAGGIAIAVSAALGLLVGAAKGRYALRATAQRNLTRIRRLREPRVWQAFGPVSLALIAGMVGLGVFLRTRAARGELGGYLVVGGIYLGIGCALLVSSLNYWRRDPPPRERRSLRLAPPGPRGVLLVQLGTPDAAETSAVKRYLRQFLSDPRVVEAPRLAWALLLRGIILPLRAPRSARAYRRVWTPEGSPLLTWSLRLAEALGRRLGPAQRVELGMRYGTPSMSEALKRLYAAGCEQVLVVPLFPQYSNSTTGSVVAEAARLAGLKRAAPSLRVLSAFPDDEGYVRAVAARAREATTGRAIDHWVLSFHGIPESYEEKGDPYGEQCARTALALAAELELDDAEWTLSFQSRFGPERWLRPYTDEVVIDLARRGARVAVLETIDEIGTELREEFEAQGGSEFVVVPALNDDPRWVEALERLVRDAS